MISFGDSFSFYAVDDAPNNWLPEFNQIISVLIVRFNRLVSNHQLLCIGTSKIHIILAPNALPMRFRFSLVDFKLKISNTSAMEDFQHCSDRLTNHIWRLHHAAIDQTMIYQFTNNSRRDSHRYRLTFDRKYLVKDMDK